jgi:hypothetical protein
MFPFDPAPFLRPFDAFIDASATAATSSNVM